MADLKAKYSNAATITITAASLGNGSARASTALDNSTNLYIDAQVGGKIKTSGASTETTGSCTIYAYASVDGGTTYTEAATGTDAAITLTAPTNAIPIGVVNTVANATTYNFGPFSVAKAFGGVLPRNWGIILVNNAGSALDATGGSFDFQYRGVQFQSV